MAVKRTGRRGNMKERLTIRQRGQVTLPKSILERFNLEEGDSLELSIDEETGEVSITPLIQVPASQSWFWKEEWQIAEKEADEDIKAGRVKSFKNVDDLIADLESPDE